MKIVNRGIPQNRLDLKGPKHETFDAGILYTNQTWIGRRLRTRPKNINNLGLGPYITFISVNFLSAYGDSAFCISSF
jgi:hypothetical protein